MKRCGQVLLPLLSLLLSSASLPAEAVQRWVLKNGLTVLVQRVPDLPLVNVTLMLGVGSSSEHPGITGIAHYVEHMSFRATENISQADITGFVDRIGGRWSGYTSLEQTAYSATAPAWALPALLRTEAERMGRARFDRPAFERERWSVIAELQGYENDPLLILWDLALATSFEIHPYRYNIIGWLSDVLAIRRDEAYHFYRNYYGPNNAVLAITGDIQVARVRSLVEQFFGSAVPAPGSVRNRVKEPPQRGEKRALLIHPGAGQHLLLVYRAPAATDPRYATMLVLDSLLAGGRGFTSFPGPVPARTGSLLQEAVEGAGGWQAFTSVTPTRSPYVFALGASAPPGASLDQIQAGIEGVLGKIRRQGVSARQLGAAARRIRAANRLQDRTLAERSDRLAYFELLHSFRLLQDLDRTVRRVTSKQIQAYIEGWMQPRQRTAARHRIGQIPGPEPKPVASRFSPSSGPPPPSPVPARALRPLLAPDLPRGTRSLANGAWLGAARGREGVAALYLRLGFGSRLDPPGQEGLALLAAQVLTASPDLQSWLEDSGAEWSNSAQSPALASNREFIDLSFVFPAAQLDRCLQLVGRALRGPWPSAWIKRARKKMLGQVAELQDDAEWQAQRAALEGLTPGRTFPRRRTVGGLTSPRVQKFLENRMRGNKVWAALVAPRAPQALLSRLSSALAPLSPGLGPELPALPRLPLPQPGREKPLFMAGKTQVQVVAALPAPACPDTDFLPLRLANVILGETGYAGRLGDALVESGLAYSVYSSLLCGRLAEPLLIRTATATTDLAATLNRVRKTFALLHQRGISESELKAAQAFLLGRMMLDLERQEVLGRRLVESGYLGQDLLDFPARSRRILQVSLSRVNAAVQRWLRPQLLSLGAAGAVGRQP